MKRLLCLYTLLILVGCTEDVSLVDTSFVMNEEFYAVIESENADSRTYIDEQIRMRWTAEDCITLFKKTTYNREYMFTGKTGSNAGGFKQVSTDDEFWYGADVPYNYAIYPHSTDTELDESGYFKFAMPAEQTYVENTFGLGANTMVAVSENGQLSFKNVCSYLRVRLYGENTSISSITLTSKGDEAIAGTAKISPSMRGNPTCEMTGNGKSIRLLCPTPVTISSDANAPTDFWMVVPPVMLSKGFTLMVENNMGDTQLFEISKSFTFSRNIYYDMVREVNIEKKEIPYLTFTADTEAKLTMSKAVATLEYSVNGGEWNELGTNTIVFGGNHGKLQLRGKSIIGTAVSISDYSYIKLEGGYIGGISCYGDIRTLIDYENYIYANTSDARFCKLFWNCRGIISAPELPATILAKSCYSGMFSDCVNLANPPQLPATTLADSCYVGMFDGCTSLKNAPELPAIILKNWCYNLMFNDCRNLIDAPQLPATTLADYCYYNMFSGCGRLINAPELPAMTLAKCCYSGMFFSCSSLINAPELPATTLVQSCYSRMFSSCSSLINAPELPATILAKYCYSGMFSSCSSLINAPKLPAITLAESCYKEMFFSCSSLINAPELPATTLAGSCYYGMYSYCSNLINAPVLPATILVESCYDEMFKNCINLVEAPKLPAKELVGGCYRLMFFGCNKLNAITMLATDIPAFGLMSWVSGVASTGTFTKAKEMTSLSIGTSGIPDGWSVINYEDDNTFEDDGPLTMEDGSDF